MARDVEVGAPVPFTITVPPEWEKDVATGSTYTFKAGMDRWVVFTQVAPDTVDGWVERLNNSDDLVASEAEVTDVAGAEGVVVDVTLREGVAQSVLLREAWGEWAITPDRPNRLWIVGVGDEILVILTDAPDTAFENWVASVEEVLGTIVWGQ